MSIYVRLGIRLLYKGLKSREMEKKKGMPDPCPAAELNLSLRLQRSGSHAIRSLPCPAHQLFSAFID